MRNSSFTWNSSLRKLSSIKNTTRNLIMWNSSLLLEFSTLEYHVRNTPLTQPQLLTYLFFFFFFPHWLSILFLILPGVGFSFSFFCQGHEGWEATIVDLSSSSSSSCSSFFFHCWNTGSFITRNFSFINLSSKWTF